MLTALFGGPRHEFETLHLIHCENQKQSPRSTLRKYFSAKLYKIQKKTFIKKSNIVGLLVCSGILKDFIMSAYEICEQLFSSDYLLVSVNGFYTCYSQALYKKAVLKKFANTQEKNPCWSFLMTLQFSGCRFYHGISLQRTKKHLIILS